MIQRIQTIYLLLAGIVTGILFFVPFAEIAGKNGSVYRFDLNGIYPEGIQKPELIINCMPLMLLLVANLILIVCIIFMYKNRILQIKLSSFSIVGLLALGGLICYYAWSGAKILASVFSFNSFTGIPFIAAILIYLAIRAIKKDEMLVRSIDRIR